MTGEWSIALKTKKDKIKKENERLNKGGKEEDGFPFPDQVEDRFHGNDRGKRGNNRKGSGDDKKKGGVGKVINWNNLLSL